MKSTEIMLCRSSTDVMLLFSRMRGRYDVQQLLLLALQLYYEVFDLYERVKGKEEEKGKETSKGKLSKSKTTACLWWEGKRTR
jgi:hypothetical protein